MGDVLPFVRPRKKSKPAPPPPADAEMYVLADALNMRDDKENESKSDGGAPSDVPFS